jgi:hypothetical protein
MEKQGLTAISRDPDFVWSEQDRARAHQLSALLKAESIERWFVDGLSEPVVDGHC